MLCGRLVAPREGGCEVLCRCLVAPREGGIEVRVRKGVEERGEKDIVINVPE